MFEIREDREAAAAAERARTLLAAAAVTPELEQVARALKYAQIAEQTAKDVGLFRRLWYWVLERVRLRTR